MNFIYLFYFLLARFSRFWPTVHLRPQDLVARHLNCVSTFLEETKRKTKYNKDCFRSVNRQAAPTLLSVTKSGEQQIG